MQSAAHNANSPLPALGLLPMGGKLGGRDKASTESTPYLLL